MHRPRVLAAAPPPALPFLDEALGAHVELVACHELEEAKRRLGEAPGVDLVLCGVYFDRSGIFDLLYHVDRRLPVLCCRILDFEMPPVSLKALQIACESLGAAFLDLPLLARQQGAGRARAELLASVLSAAQPRSRLRL